MDDGYAGKGPEGMMDRDAFIAFNKMPAGDRCPGVAAGAAGGMGVHPPDRYADRGQTPLRLKQQNTGDSSLCQRNYSVLPYKWEFV